MKPAPFHYHRPSEIGEVLEILDEAKEDFEREVKVLAGGQSLIPAMNFRLARPTELIDLQEISELTGIKEDAGGVLTIGAMTRQRSAEFDPLVSRRAPLLRETMPFIAHPQIRNRGTIGGTVAHADPAAELPAIVLALDAQLHIENRSGSRTVPASEFFVGLFETALQPEDLLTAISIQPPRAGEGSAFAEVSRRSGDYALCGCAARLSVDEEGNCRLARLTYLSVGDRPTRARQAEALLVDENLSSAPQAIRAAAEHAATCEIEPGDDIHASAKFRRHLAKGLAEQTLSTAYRRAIASHRSP